MIPINPIIMFITAILKRKFPDLLGDGERIIGRRRGRVEFSDENVECCSGNHQHKRRKLSKLCKLSSICETNTFTEHVNRVLGWLQNDDLSVGTIGIYGMGGVGKTVIAQFVHDQVRNLDVGWVSVGKDFSVGSLQGDIAKEFGIDFQGDRDETRRAGTLNTLLGRIGKSVLFVDDLWGGFRREDIGIPKECKLVLVSRSLSVCQMMRCQRIVKVEPLPQEEGWLLFRHTMKDDMEGFREKAEFWCRECGGVPYAINSLVKNMRGVVDVSRRCKTVESLSTTHMGQIILEDIFGVLRHSYDSLSGSKLKECFLHCALYPKDYAISREELIRLWIAVKLIDEALPLQVQYDMGQTILNKLVSFCLLDSYGDKRVKMHDLVRRMALSISGDRFSVKSGMSLTGASTLLDWQKNLHVAAVSLIDSTLQIPSDTSPDCPTLSALLMQHNPLQVLPNPFFLHFPSLRYLNLSHTPIEVLPSSISALGELLVLDLSWCQNLKQVASLAELQKLKFLDLRNTAIGQVPCSLQKLIMLTELNLSFVCKLKEFPKGVLPALSKLKRLSCDIAGTIPDLRSLKSLEILDVRFNNLFDLSIYVRSEQWRTLKSFHLQVGHNKIAEQTLGRAVSLQGCSFAGEQGDYMVLPNNIQELNVDDCRGFSSLSDILNPVYASNCGNCAGGNCSGSLHCNGCRGLSQPAGDFASLEICTIRRCPDIEKVFPSTWMLNLKYLQVITVEDCEKMKELLTDEVGKTCVSEVNHSVISLPYLQKLKLARLPLLTCIYKGTLACASVQTLSFIDCPKLNRLPISFVDGQGRLSHSSIEWIEGEEEWWNLLQWDETKSKAMLKRVFKHRV